MPEIVDDNMASQGESAEADEVGEMTALQVTDNNRDPTPSANSRKRQDRERMVKSCIDEALATHGPTLELNNLEISTIPESLLQLNHVQYLYLAGNKLKMLPENFFECLRSIQWLDLRRNYLVNLPSAYVGRHQCLRTLLLENNELRTLPLELGLVATLSGLNIANNPLEFPPQDVIQKGTQAILSFFRDLLSAKSEGRVMHEEPTPSEDVDDSDDLPEEEPLDFQKALRQDDSDSDSDWTRPRSHVNLNRRNSQDSSHSKGDHKGDYDDLVGPVPQSASLHNPHTYSDLKQVQINRLRRQSSKDGKRSSASRKVRRRDHRQQNEPPSQEQIEQRYLEERKMARLRELKEKQNQLLQRRKDHEQLKAFREDSRQLQYRKEREKRIKGKLDYDAAAETAPYDVDDEHMKMPTNEERIAADIREKHEQMRGKGRPLSPESILRLEEARRERDRQLEKRIREHTASMQERKRKPKGNAQEEMHAAMEELRIAEQLQLEIAARRKDLEYRFTAFTGDNIPMKADTANNQKRIKVKPPLAPILPGRT